MANIIKLKRGPSTHIDDAVITQGELVITTDTAKLYTVDQEGNKIILNKDVVNISELVNDKDYVTRTESNAQLEDFSVDLARVDADVAILSAWVNSSFNSDVVDIINEEVGQQIEDLQEIVDQLYNTNISTAYIYEDSNGNLVITKNGYLGKIMIYNDRTSLMIGNEEIAYVKDGKLFVTAIKTNSIQIGSWLYEVTSAGTLNEKWVGDN